MFDPSVLPEKHFGRCVCLIQAINTLDRPTLGSISELTKMNKSTITRTLGRLEDQYRMNIQWVGTNRAGHYEIHNWGLINKSEALSYTPGTSEAPP